RKGGTGHGGSLRQGMGCSLAGRRLARAAAVVAIGCETFCKGADGTERPESPSITTTIRIQEFVLSRVLFLTGLLTLPAFAAEPVLYGRYEHIKIEEIGKILPAKM